MPGLFFLISEAISDSLAVPRCASDKGRRRPAIECVPSAC